MNTIFKSVIFALMFFVDINLFAQSKTKIITEVTSNDVSTVASSKTKSGWYYTFLASEHSQITKPYIIVEGFDPLNNQSLDYYFGMYSNLINALNTQNYDVILLDFDDANDYIQNNAMLLIALINKINSEKVEKGNNMVLMGYSMGGLIARYALTRMEAYRQDHQTRLYVSHDVPHKGANFPLGMQEFFYGLATKVAPVNIVGSVLFNSIELTLPAAKQMMVYHHENSSNGVARPSQSKIDFFNELYNLNPVNNGYPSKPLKIAVSNGNYSGKKQSLQENEIILSYNYSKTNDCWWVPDAFIDQLSATVRTGFSDVNPIEEFRCQSAACHVIGNTGIRTYLNGSGSKSFSSNNISYDAAPGSTSAGFFQSMANQIQVNLGVDVTYKDNMCFIPTFSALDLNIDINASFDLKNTKCLTIFDHVFANKSLNMDHTDIIANEAKDFIMTYVNGNEKTTMKTSGIANIEIPTGFIVNSTNTYNKMVSNSISNLGSFIIKSDGRSSLQSGNTIHLKPGFKTESGANFHAIVKEVSCNDGIEFVPNYYIESMSNPQLSIVSNTTVNYRYNDNIKNQNVNSLEVKLNENKITELTSDTKNSFNLYPNPTNGKFNVLLNNFDVNKVIVYDSFGKLILEYIIDENMDQVSIDLTGYPSGMYFIKVASGNEVHTSKLMKN